MISKLSELSDLVCSQKKRRQLVLAVAQDKHALEAVCTAASKGFVEPILVGDAAEISTLLQSLDHDPQKFAIEDLKDQVLAVERSVRLISSGQANILMKGSCSTSMLLKGVLNRDWGLRKGELLSHFAWFGSPFYHKMLGVTDVAINIAPTIDQKRAIVENAVDCLHRLGIAVPRVAAIAAVEVVNEQMPATVDAGALAGMNRDGVLTGCVVEGPLALDNALSAESARHKKIGGLVPGEPDLLLMPDIEAGNVFYKALTYLSEVSVASVVLGATAPIVLTSRSDSPDSKLNSILLAASI